MAENIQKVILTADDLSKAAFDSFRRNVAGADKSVSSLEKSAALLRRGIGALGVGFSFAAVTGQAKELESALIGVRKTTGLTDRQIDDFNSRINDMTKRLPVARLELLGIAQAAGQMGVQGVDNLEKFTETIVKLERSSDLVGETGAKALARILAVTGENIGSIDRLASVIVALGNNVAASESEITKMTNEVARSTSVFKVSSAEAAAMAAAMSAIGVRAELGGSSVGRAMQEITSRVQAGGDDLREFARVLNLNSDALAATFAENKTQAFELFLRAVGDLGLDAGNALEKVGLGGQEIAKTIIPLANNMDIFVRTMELANAEVTEATALNREFEEQLKSTDSQWEISKNIVSGYASTLGDTLLPVINSVLKKFNELNQAPQLSPIQQQEQLVGNLESRIRHLRALDDSIGFLPFAGTSKREFDQLDYQLESAREKLDKLRLSAGGAEESIEKVAEAFGGGGVGGSGSGGGKGGLAGGTNDADKAARAFLDSLRREAREAGLTGAELKRLQAAHFGVSGEAEELIKKLERVDSAMDAERRATQEAADALSNWKREQQDALRIFESNITAEEQHNINLAETKRLLDQNLISQETYNREVERLSGVLDKSNEKTRDVFQSMEQIAISAVRNIQSTFANGLFDFITQGTSNMASNFVRVIGRMVSEVASMRIFQSTGLGAALGLGSNAAFAGGAEAGSGLSALNIAGTGSALLNAYGYGFGIPGLVGGGLQSLGSLAGSNGLFQFGAGLSGDLLAAGGGFAGGLGSTLGSFAGPLALAGIADIGLRSIFGDKKLGGTAGDVLSYVPVVGTLINGLFGRGAPKPGRQDLVGTLTPSGFEGVFNQGFKEKGGLARSSRFSNFIVDTDSGQLLNGFGRLSESGNIPRSLRDAATDPAIQRALEIGSVLDESMQQISASVTDAAEKLGIGTSSLNDFSFAVDLVTEKGQQLTDADIAGVISDASNQMVQQLIPSIADLARNGETAVDAFVRLSAETKSLETALLFTGESAAQARASVQGLSFEQRTEITDQFGGAAALNAQLDNFFNSVLDESKQLEIVEAQVRDVAESFGLDFIPTLEQLADGFEQGSLETKRLILENDDLIIQYQSLKDSVEGLGETTKEVSKEVSNFTNEDFKDMMRVIAQERRSFTAARREQQAGGLAPTIATTIGGRIFSADEIKAQQQGVLDSAFEQASAIVREQINRLDESMRNARDMIRDQISGVRESISFFDKFKQDALDVSNSSFAASRAQLEASISLVRAGTELEQVDTPELAKAIDTLKQDRSQFFSTRKEFELDKAQTAQKIEELSLAGTSRAEQTISLLTDQLDVMQATYDLQAKRLNGALDFVFFQGGRQRDIADTASTLNDESLSALFGDSLKSLNQAERIRRNTSFNGSVVFASAPGTNESADRLDAARRGLINDFIADSGAGRDVTSELRTELAELKKETKRNGEITQGLVDFFNSLTPDGRSLRVTS